LEVGIKDRRVFAPCLGEGSSDGDALAAVVLVREHPETLVALESSQHLRRAVGGTVVYHDQLERRRQVCAEHLCDRLADALPFVEHGHQDGEHLLSMVASGVSGCPTLGASKALR